MKLFRRITALALTLVVIAMFGISASAASFKVPINGDFSVGAEFEGDLTARKATATATLYGADVDNIEIVEHRIQIVYTYFRNGDSSVQTHYADTPPDWIAESFEVEATLDSNCIFSSATYYYDATYVANGDVYCYLHHGPEVLTIP